MQRRAMHRRCAARGPETPATIGVQLRAGNDTYSARLDDAPLRAPMVLVCFVARDVAHVGK